MSQIISIEFPEYLANSMRMNKSEFGKEIKISGLVKLFELGKISSGTAAKVLQLSRIEFLELLAKCPSTTGIIIATAFETLHSLSPRFVAIIEIVSVENLLFRISINDIIISLLFRENKGSE